MADLVGHGVVLYFPAAFSPGCTREVCGFRDSKEAWQAAGYQLYGISADPPERLREFREAHGVNHALLSDAEFDAARAWGAYGAKSLNGQPTIGRCAAPSCSPPTVCWSPPTTTSTPPLTTALLDPVAPTH